VRPPIHDQPLAIVSGGCALAKKTLGIGAFQQIPARARLGCGFVADDIGQSPRRPKLFV
jgi:hypothetical protein